MANPLSLSTAGLKIVDLARRNLGWTKSSDIWCKAALTSKATLKRFWAQQPIRKDTFIEICKAVGIDNWEDIVQASATQKIDSYKPAQGFALPENLPPVRHWVRCIPEINVLKAQILNLDTKIISATAICIVGLPGIGKTTLASQLVRQLHIENTPFVIAAWESLRSPTGKPPRFDVMVDSLFFTLSPLLNGENQRAILNNDTDKKIDRLLKLIKYQSCLLVFDNVETVLKTGQAQTAGYFADFCTEYAWFFKKLVETEHESKIIFISRESLAELPTTLSREISLNGIDGDTGVELLQSFNLTANTSELAQLASRYQGHPKALEILAGLIRDDREFQGNVSIFLQDRDWLLIRDLESMIDESMCRLSNLAQTCLSRISVYQTSEYPLSFAGIAAQMPELSSYQLKENIILELKRRQLLFYDHIRASGKMHVLVQEKANRVLCENPESLRNAHRQAYHYFFNIPLEPQAKWQNIQDTKALMRANYHAAQAEDRSLTFSSLRHL